MPAIEPSSAAGDDADGASAAEAVESAGFDAPVYENRTPTEGGSISLRVRTPNGDVRVMEAAADEPVSALAARAAAMPELGLGSRRVAVLHSGVSVGPEATPRSLSLCDGDALQLAQRSISLTSRPEAADLVFSCSHCRASDAPMLLRPLCSVCGSEAVRVTAGSCKVGSVRWEQLLEARVQCFECGAQNSPAGIGFLCDRKHPETSAPCPSRAVQRSDASLAHRGFSHVFSGTSRDVLAAVLQRAFSGE